MIREGGIQKLTTSRVDLLNGTQFSTITKPMDFVVRAAVVDAAGGTAADRLVNLRFRRGSIALSEVELDAESEITGGVQGAEDAEMFRGRVMPGNLYLEVSQSAAGANEGARLEWDITAY